MNENPFQQVKVINDYSDDSLTRNKCDDSENLNVLSNDL